MESIHMHRAIRYQYVIRVSALFLVLVTALTGCGTGLSPSTSVASATATSTISPTATPLTTAASTVGWVAYHDLHYPFQVPVPPRWQTATFTNSDSKSSCTGYDINFFPPDRKPVLMEPTTEFNPEVISITFESNCPSFDPTSYPGLAAEPDGITINGVSTQMYGLTNSTGEIWWIAVLPLGRSDCHFSIHSPANTAKRDLSVFLGMLSGFKYAGQ